MERLLTEKFGLFMDIDELATLLKIKRQTLYQQIYKNGLDIPHLKRGKKYLFPTTAVAEHLKSLLNLPHAG